MKSVKFILVTLAFLFLMAGQRQVKYFLSELDFLSDRNVPKSEVIRKDHIRAEYDDLNRLIFKVFINRSGKNLNQEQYVYVDTNRIARQKDLINLQGQVYSQTIFGREEQSVSYIKWVFGVDSVKRWNDRFTTSGLNNLNKPINYSFFDVNAFEYGGKEFNYDSIGRVTRNDWLRRPDGKSMHKFLYKYYDDLEITHMFEYDSNGVLIMDVKLSADGTEAVFWFLGPPDTSFINTSEILYNLDGDLKWGYLNWVVPGSRDSSRVDLQKINRGDHAVALKTDSVLIDSLSYNIYFDGEGVKGYMATKRILKNLMYDISPPIMTLEMDKYMKEVALSFTRSEPIDSAFIIWTPDSNFQSVPVDTVYLVKDELNLLSRFSPTDQIFLRDGVMYDPAVYGIDRAGNVSKPGIFKGVIYDVTPPVLSIVNPASNSWINNQSMSISTNEPIQSWSILIASNGEFLDPAAPHSYEFLDTVNNVSNVNLSSYFELSDGSMYSFGIVGSDLAGNISDTIKIDSVHYDITEPVITMIYPFSGAAINNTAISYAISEQLKIGDFFWTQVEGTADTLSPHRVEMIGPELYPDEKIRVFLENDPILTDGAVYSLTANGQDLAGNNAEIVSISNIVYDTTPPSFSEVGPDSGSALNHQRVFYTISENLLKGQIMWFQTGGINDPDAPHSVELDGKELEGGAHDSTILINMPRLQDGGVYSIIFSGSDRAGNTADTVTIVNVLYDFTIPEIEINYPFSRLITNKTSISYTLSEDFYSANFKWEWKSGISDTSAPHVSKLTLNEKKSGVHPETELENQPKFVENTVYMLTFSGSDRAGNLATEAIIVNLEYDFTPPVLTWYSPISNAAVNHKEISLDKSEFLESALVTWTWTGGVSDSDSIHAINLFKDELNPGKFGPATVINSPQLVDGGIYSISITAFDPAGNESNQININNILYDITKPVITLSYPLPSSISKTTTATYSLSETLFKGEFKWVWTSGVADNLAPYVAILTPEEKEVGNHVEIELSNIPLIVENAIYTMSVTGIDRAGNKAKTVFIPSLQYDFTPPELSVISPEEGEAVNHKKIQFSNSELLQTALMIWVRTGGEPDLLSPHISDLRGVELEVGQRKIPKILNNSPNLNNGSEYRLLYVGYDPAGNISDTVKVENILYDTTLPVLAVNYPKSNIYTRESKILFSASEDIFNFKINWDGISVNGISDNIEYQLDEKLLAGDYNSDDLIIPDLKDSTVYKIKLNGQDRAKNLAIESSISDIKIDLTPPVFTEMTPKANSFINIVNIGWFLSEDIDNGKVLFLSAETKNPLEAILIGEELKSGVRSPGPLENFVGLRDGRLYEFSFQGSDFAGNKSKSYSTSNITFDTSPPELFILSPENESFVNSNHIKYSTNEPLLEAKMIWIGKKMDPIEFELKSKDLSAGEHLLKNYGVIPVEKVYYDIHIEGVDRATNRSISDTLKNVTFDITPPEFSIIAPALNSPVNSSEISFTISEPLNSGFVKWVATGDGDLNSPHVRPLIEKHMQKGVFRNFTFVNPPQLKDGIVYRIELEGIDLAGNEGGKAYVENILYDVTPPMFIDVLPLDSAFIKEPNISFTLTENLLEGKIYFENTGGVSDPKITHMITLAGGKKNKGKQGGKLPSSFIKLVNGSIYNIKFEGKDAADNQAPEVIIKNIVFDNESPVVDFLQPQNNTYVNSEVVSYTLSEDLAESKFELKQVGGQVDPNSPYIIKLSKESRMIGEYKDIIFPQIKWVDGAIYSLSLQGTDFAGNNSKSVIRENINYDITPPSISIDNFNNKDYINTNGLSYTLSESLLKSTIIFSQVDGKFDANSPHVISLKGRELTVGSYESILLANGLSLTNGSTYKVEFNGEDFALNPSNEVLVEGLVFDNEPPKISISQPIDSEQIKSTIISYLTSETLEFADVIFSQSSGTIDTNSPHKVSLKGVLLNKGVHSDYNLNITSNLADGGRYTVSIEAKDRAGNIAITAPINDVFFDLLPPVLSIEMPLSGSRFNALLLTYGSNEQMGKGSILFTRTSGAQDPNSPHLIELTGNRLGQGVHYEESFDDDIILKDGSTYKISFGGQDMAGNIALDVSVENITFDSSPPTISISSPDNGEFFNKIILSYSLNENLNNGDIIVERSGGPTDPASPHKIELFDQQLVSGNSLNLTLNESVTLTSNVVYNIIIEGVDVAGNSGKSKTLENITFDNIPPDLSIFSPAPETFFNKAILGLKTNEVLSIASVDWVWLEGNSDPTKQHNSKLVGGNLDEGEYPEISFSPPPDLISGAWYSVTFNGKDRAGNFTNFNLGRLFFDNIPPSITSNFPVSGAHINLPEIEYNLNESLLNGKILWKPQSGGESLNVELTSTELLKGSFQRGVLVNQSDLLDGEKYDIEFIGADSAGNKTEKILAKNVTFDQTKPAFTEVFPLASSRINKQYLEWNVDEELQSGKYTWIHMGGEADSNAPHEYSLTDKLLKPGKYDNSTLPNLNLVVNAMYRITLEGMDLAGNTGKKFIMSVVYDDIPPTLELKYPSSNTSVNHLDIAYYVSEQLSEGQLVYTRVGGDPDPSSPVKLDLVGVELESIFESPQLTKNPPTLNDGTVYNIQFIGKDLASNSSKSNIVENVKYDATRPVITVFYPESKKYFMGSEISIDISEDLMDGAMVWTRTGGLNDKLTKQSIPLYDQYLKKGKYGKAKLPLESLSSSVIYSLSVDAQDYAGNQAEPVLIEYIEYIRNMAGKWFYKGAIIEVVWVFEPDASGLNGKFTQGLSLGTKISNEEKGSFNFNFSQKPFVLSFKMDDPKKNRTSLVQFLNNNRIRVVTGQRKPTNMTDGEIMEYQFRE